MFKGATNVPKLMNYDELVAGTLSVSPTAATSRNPPSTSRDSRRHSIYPRGIPVTLNPTRSTGTV